MKSENLKFLRFAGVSGNMSENVESVCETRQIFTLMSAQLDSKYLLC